jgi:hypothetical protein
MLKYDWVPLTVSPNGYPPEMVVIWPTVMVLPPEDVVPAAEEELEEEVQAASPSKSAERAAMDAMDRRR